ncbi:hypothetical protein BV898_01304 [Hypsibius exemplaris]|uniref:Uncharacterized protein n=1 Tax=Hypsibius exemplaris TaxID=2072580 RepID=A0A1W0XBM0_HYPEX|nr:hypothetical protein BV898_01304 [Hypsibius exemplaris]
MEKSFRYTEYALLTAFAERINGGEEWKETLTEKRKEAATRASSVGSSRQERQDKKKRKAESQEDETPSIWNWLSASYDYIRSGVGSCTLECKGSLFPSLDLVWVRSFGFHLSSRLVSSVEPDAQ